MADQVIDKLIYALGGDISDLMVAFHEAEKEAEKSGKKVGDSFNKGVNDAQTKLGNDLDKIKNAFDKSGEGAKKLGGHIQVSRREMVYFFRELLNGDVQRLPTTFALMASHLLEISPAAIAAGAAIAAIPAAVVIAAAKADIALASLRTNMALTANFAGVSLSQATTMASAASGGGHLSVMGAQGIMGGLIGAGVPGSSLQLATQTAGQYSLGAGATHDQSRELIARMFQDPSKAAEEMQTQFHLLTVAQMEEVKDLQARGETEKAANIILQEFSGRTKEAADQASIFSKAINAAGNLIGNIGHGFALMAGGGSAQEKLNLLEAQNRDYRASIGNSFPGENGVMATQDMPGYAARKKMLSDQIAAENAEAAKKGKLGQDEAVISQAYKNVLSGTGAYDERVKKLDADVDLLTKAFDKASHSDRVADVKVEGSLRNQLDAAKVAAAAVKAYGSPEAEAAQRRRDAAELARTPLDRRAIVSARQAADAQDRQRRMSGTVTEAQARALHGVDLATADFAGSEKAMQQKQALEAMQLQASTAVKVADAYKISTAAANQAAIVGEIEVAVKNRQIAASDRMAAILAKESQAFAQANAVVSQYADRIEEANKGMAGEVAAGGVPYLISAAKRKAEVDAQIKSELDRANGDPVAILKAEQDRKRLTGDLAQRDLLAGQARGNASIYSAREDLGYLGQTMRATAAGASDDQLRHLQVFQDTLRQMPKELDPSSKAFQDIFKTLLPLNEQLSDLNDQFGKMTQLSKNVAGDITGGLSNYVRNPTQNPADVAANIGQNVLGDVVDSQILEPMNKWLTSQFDGLFGVGQLGASVAKPMYVSVVPGVGGLLGGDSGGGGGLLGGLGKLLGLGGGGSDPFSGAIDTMMSDPALMAFGGPTRPGNAYVVGDAGPEIYQEAGPGGYVTPLTAPVVRAALGQQNVPNQRITAGGDTYQLILPNVTEPQQFIRARSQVSAALTTAATIGKRNK